MYPCWWVVHAKGMCMCVSGEPVEEEEETRPALVGAFNRYSYTTLYYTT